VPQDAGEKKKQTVVQRYPSPTCACNNRTCARSDSGGKIYCANYYAISPSHMQMMNMAIARGAIGNSIAVTVGLGGSSFREIQQQLFLIIRVAR